MQCVIFEQIFRSYDILHVENHGSSLLACFQGGMMASYQQYAFSLPQTLKSE